MDEGKIQPLKQLQYFYKLIFDSPVRPITIQYYKKNL